MAKSSLTFNKKNRDTGRRKKQEEKLQKRINKKFRPKSTFEDMLITADKIDAVERIVVRETPDKP